MNQLFRLSGLFPAACAVVIACAAWHAPPAAAGLFNPETFTLANGMQVVVISDHRAPVVTHMVWYKIGSADQVKVTVFGPVVNMAARLESMTRTFGVSILLDEASDDRLRETSKKSAFCGATSSHLRPVMIHGNQSWIGCETKTIHGLPVRS